MKDRLLARPALSFEGVLLRHPARSMRAWRADILSRIPGYRNKVMVVDEKP